MPAALLAHSEGGDQLVDGHGNLAVRNSAGELVGVENQAKLAILHAGNLDLGLLDVLETNLLEVVQAADTREVGGLEITLVEDLHVLLVVHLGLALLLVELHAGVQDGLVAHVEELIVVGLEDILEDLGSGHGLAVDLAADESLSEGVRVDGTNAGVLGGRVGAGLLAEIVILAHVDEVLVLVDVALARGAGLALNLVSKDRLNEGEDIAVSFGVANVTHFEVKSYVEYVVIS